MKTTLFMAMSINGLIATDDYGEDFLDGTWKYLVELGNKYGCIIWGRTTYELVNKMSSEYPKSIEHIKKIVISSNPEFPLKENSYLFSTPEGALNWLKEQNYSEVLLSGGSQLNSSFAKLGLIDEVILVIDSVIEGKGIPLFAPDIFELKLIPLKSEIHESHLVYLHFRVVKDQS